MKKKILLLAVLAICIASAASGTLAYFTAEDTAHNVITSGNVEIKVVEKTLGEDHVLRDFPKEGIHGVMPAAKISKIVQIQNTGTGSAWIRVKIQSYITGPTGEAMPLTIGNDQLPVMSYIVQEGWKEGVDGYWYHVKPVASKEYTSILLEEICFEPTLGNEYQDCTANVVISAQAVQVSNNAATISDVVGWPKE